MAGAPPPPPDKALGGGEPRGRGVKKPCGREALREGVWSEAVSQWRVLTAKHWSHRRLPLPAPLVDKTISVSLADDANFQEKCTERPVVGLVYCTSRRGSTGIPWGKKTIMRLRLPEFSILKMFCFVIVLPTSMVLITIATMHHDSREFRVTHEVFLEVEMDGAPVGTMVVGLFGDDAPRTVKNFMTFATKGYKGYMYKGTAFHRVIKKFMIQGGDVVSGDGQGSISIYGATFPDENLDIKHSRPGFLSMANKGKDTNGCQFFITTIATPWLDGRHVVFGKVVEGEAVLHKVEYLPTDWNDRPLKEVLIAKAGRRVVHSPYYITDDPYNLKDWLKTISIPLGLSLAIIIVFNYFIKRLDNCIIDDDGSMDDEATVSRKQEQEERQREGEGKDTAVRKRRPPEEVTE